MVKKIVRNSLNILLVYGIMQFANFLANKACSHARKDDQMFLTYTAVYIVVAVVIGIAYISCFLNFSPKDLGIQTKMPSPLWIVVGILPPGATICFYLLFGNGEFLKSGTVTLSVVMFTICVGISAGVVEEFIFRGVMMGYMEKTLGTIPSILVPSILFAAIHVKNIKPFSFTSVAMVLVAGSMVAVMFSVIRWATGSIWPGAIVHGIWNAAIIGRVLCIAGNGNFNQAVFRYKLSSKNILLTGGSFGIEAGVPAVMVYFLFTCVVFFIYRGRKKTPNQFLRAR